jgi:hypothetical protein
VLDLLAVRQAAMQPSFLPNVPGPAWGMDEQGGATPAATALVRDLSSVLWRRPFRSAEGQGGA